MSPDPLRAKGPEHGGGIPAETTPTWEMELLVSGATVFGLFQLPSRLDAIFYDLFNRSSERVTLLLLPLWMYAKVALITLIGTFVLHLVLRGLWVAMVGLDSVYPGGINPGRLRGGPFTRRVAEELPGMSERIEAADNRATRVFGVGFGLAMVMLFPFGLVLIGLGLALLGEAMEKPRLTTGVLLVGALCAALPPLLSNLLDRRLGARISPRGRVGRALLGTFRFYQRLGVSRGSNPLLALFQTNEGTRKAGVVILLVMLVSSALVLMQFASDSGDLSFGNVAGLPPDQADAADVLVAQHYRSTRGEARSPRPASSIPDRVVQGPYLELFVPVTPRLHEPALRAECPTAVADAEAGVNARPALDCLGRILDLRLDGAPVHVPLDAASDPVTDLRGVVAMIPVSELAAGRHEVTVAQLSRPGREARKPERIPFWK